jgi:hypothetical protein
MKGTSFSPKHDFFHRFSRIKRIILLHGSITVSYSQVWVGTIWLVIYRNLYIFLAMHPFSV